MTTAQGGQDAEPNQIYCILITLGHEAIVYIDAWGQITFIIPPGILIRFLLVRNDQSEKGLRLGTAARVMAIKKPLLYTSGQRPYA